MPKYRYIKTIKMLQDDKNYKNFDDRESRTMSHKVYLETSFERQGNIIIGYLF